jgi:hypothetical protein
MMLFWGVVSYVDKHTVCFFRAEVRKLVMWRACIGLTEKKAEGVGHHRQEIGEDL